MSGKKKKQWLTDFDRGWLFGLAITMIAQDIIGPEKVMESWVTAWITVPVALLSIAAVWHTRKR